MNNLEQILFTLPSSAFYKDDFSGNTLSDDWTLTLDPQHTSSVDNSCLKITADTTSGQSQLLCSGQNFSIPMRIGFLIAVSQRIDNQEIIFGIKSADGQDSVNVIFDGTNPNKAKISCSYANFHFGNNDITIPTSVDFTKPVLVEIDCLQTEVRFYFRNLDAKVSDYGNSGYSLQRNTPSLALDYQLYLIVNNKSTTSKNTEIRLDKVYAAKYSQTSSDGGNTTNGLTDSELRASPVAVTSTTLLSAGTAPNGITGPTTGTGTYRWLGAIWQLFTDFLSRIPAALVGGKLDVNVGSQSKALLATTFSQKWREDFNGSSLNLSEWTVLQTGSGHSVSVSNSDLVISPGVAANTETIIRSNRLFTIPVRVLVVLSISQRIANQEFYLELVDSASGDNLAQILFDVLGNATAKVAATNYGSSTGFLNNSSLSNLNSSYGLVELDLTSDELNFYPRGQANVIFPSGRATGTTLNRQIPDPNLQYFFRIRVKNLAPTPASNTTYRIDAILFQDIEEITAEITAGRGGGNINQSIPVIFAATQPVTVVGGDINLSAVRNVFAITTTTLLLANATYNSSTVTGIASFNSLKGVIFADVDGILYVEQSANNTNWEVSDIIQCKAGTTFIKCEIYAAWYRVRYVNGGTNQTTFRLNIYSCLF